jgi:hypothetical protein
LTDINVGAIVTQLGYRTLVNKLLAGHEQVATSVILDQFYKSPELPAPAEPRVVARAIQLGVKDGVFGLAELREEEVDPATLKFKTDIPLDAIPFEPGVYLVSQTKCEALLEEMTAAEEEVKWEEEEAGKREEEDKIIEKQDEVETGGEQKYQRVRLVVENIPVSKIADAHRGILMPISAAVRDFKFTLEIDVTSAEGISQSTLENKIKETIRQIGARLRDEQLE